ncbi:MAG: glycogen/starch/alpha-glucan phosphorylase [Tissierellia bacterium]|nr:glycogen/starch/alpha-glucan phosphorylase [Tissierellia bacterium]
MFDKKLFLDTFKISLRIKFGKELSEASDYEKYYALAYTIMSLLSHDWKKTSDEYKGKKMAYYISAEFLIGRSLGNNLINLAMYDFVKEILDELDIDINCLEEIEEDAALGNGGLGRLAACFMESAATLNLPVMGYGARYSEGILKQRFIDGFQFEEGDNWLKNGDPWSLRKESEAQLVEFRDMTVKAVPYDMPMMGYDTLNINTLRLWQAEAICDFDFQRFNNFEYDKSLESKNRAEDLTRVLYPNDEQRVGKVLRLKQQYFFSSASIKDIIVRYKIQNNDNIEGIEDYVRIQLNDTHPVIAISEFIRILVDKEECDFNKALAITRKIFSYTNHTILQEALECWSIDIVDEVNPRNLEIIRLINDALIAEFRWRGINETKIDQMKIIDGNIVKMANLGIYMSHTINGVAKLHTEILKNEVLATWNDYFPEKFQNKTNGITPRRWLKLSNPELSDFITELNGNDEWLKDLTQLKKLEQYKDDKQVLEKLNDIKLQKKIQLAEYLRKHEDIIVNPESIFDVQVKRIHEYKRQLLNAFHIVYLYFKLKENPNLDILPRTFIFGGKAAPGYFRAKAIIKYINEIARVVNNDLSIKGKLKVIFVENYRVSYGEKIFPAADISEQISTAGKEASGTGNMKFMLNATPTIGTFDGANIEIVKEAGIENNFIFGATVEELRAIKNTYQPVEFYLSDPELRQVVDSLMSGLFKDNDTFMLLGIYNSLLKTDQYNEGDNYFVLKDFKSYVEAQKTVDAAFRNRTEWAKKCLMNLANAGAFSSDRTIKEYAEDIWGIESYKI